MNSISGTIKSSIGSKILMAATGILLIVFLIGHLLGNLQVFAGQGQLNTYAEKLHALPALLWAFRIVMLAAIVIHIFLATKMTLQNRSARPVGYVQRDLQRATFSSRTMMIGGVTIGVFIVYHLLQFTFGVIDPQHYVANMVPDAAGRPDVYSMLIHGFNNILVVGLYALALVWLGLHLTHGASSFFQSLGMNSPRLHDNIHRVGLIFTVIMTVGYLSIPASIMLGIVKLPTGGM